MEIRPSQRPPAKPEAWGRWRGPRPHGPAGDVSQSLPNPCISDVRPRTRIFQRVRSFPYLVRFTIHAAHTTEPRYNLRLPKSFTPPPTIPEASNCWSPPAEPEHFLWINQDGLRESSANLPPESRGAGVRVRARQHGKLEFPPLRVTIQADNISTHRGSPVEVGSSVARPAAIDFRPVVSGLISGDGRILARL